MVDLAMHMMDIVQNSIRAEASKIEIEFVENNRESTLLFSVKDNGYGMSEEMTEKIANPFFTTRTTRKVGLGIPFLKMTSEQTGGYLKIQSKPGVGTTTEAVYKTDNPDCLPLGDIAGYLTLLFIGNPEIHFSFNYRLNEKYFSIDTLELIEQGITELSNNEMAEAVKEYINENLKELFLARQKGSFLC